MERRTVRLGVDFGTSNTVAMISVNGEKSRPLLFDGSPVLPSAVCAQPSGQLLTGRDAIHLGLAEPAAFEPHPKRCIDDGSVLLAGIGYRTDQMFTAVLARVLAEAYQVGSGPPDSVIVTCPAVWGQQRQAVLRAAAPPRSRLISEPVAAASYFSTVAGHRIAPGTAALVYDLGAGTFDASVVRRTDQGFEVLAGRGRSDAAGLDIDAAIVAHLRAAMTGPEQWGRLERPTTAADRRARLQLWDGVRRAKEMLSRSSTTLIHVPLFDTEVPLGRETLDQLAVPVLDRTVATAREVLAEASIPAGRLAAIFTAGGGARMPMVSTVLLRSFGLTPTTAAQPELVVAEGALHDPSSRPPIEVAAPNLGSPQGSHRGTCSAPTADHARPSTSTSRHLPSARRSSRRSFAISHSCSAGRRRPGHSKHPFRRCREIRPRLDRAQRAERLTKRGHAGRAT